MGISYEGASHVIWTEGSSSLLWVGRYIPEEDDDYNDDGEPGDCLHSGHPAHPHHRHLPPSDAALSKSQVVMPSFFIILLFWISSRLQLMSANGRVGSKTFAEEVTNQKQSSKCERKAQVRSTMANKLSLPLYNGDLGFVPRPTQS